MKGTVQRFSRMHGYGFLVDETNEYVFFHVTQWKDYGHVHIGDRVVFDKVIIDNRASAQNVRKERTADGKSYLETK